MNEVIRIIIDGKECLARRGKYIVEAAKENGIFIPTLCNYEGVKPKGACRVCTCKINNRYTTACTTPVSEGMQIENDTPELFEMRKAIVELFFAEGNHFCPSCEKSGNCELQALAYWFKIMVPRFPNLYPKKRVDASHPKLILDHNRCILCKRCVRVLKDTNGNSFFAYRRRGQHIEVILDKRLANQITDNIAQLAENVCPVGCIMQKRIAYTMPIGQRKYDRTPIGQQIKMK